MHSLSSTAAPVLDRSGSPVQGAPSGCSRGEAVDAAGCADAVLDTVPRVMDAMRTAMRQQVGEQLSVPQFRCLNFIALQPGCSIGAVAAFLGVTMPTASAMVDRLVRAGVVRPSTPARDRRRSQLHLTPAGRAQLQDIRAGAHAEFRRALSVLSAEQLLALQGGLDVLRLAFPAA